MIKRRLGHIFCTCTGLGNIALRQVHVWSNPCGPLRACIQMYKVHRTVGLAHLQERPRTRTEAEVSRIERPSRVALLRRLIEHAGIPQHITESKVSVRTPRE